MPSDTKNVKVGPCRVYYDGIDLGYTKGGVEVEVSTDSYKSNVDQFGKTPISEIIQGRMVKAKVPMAETTIENMVLIMPGASLVQAGGAKASGTITIATNPTTGQTILVNGRTITFRTSPTAVASLNEVNLGGTTAITATNLQAFLQASTDVALAVAQYSVATNVVTATYNDFGTVGNAYTLVTGTAAAAVTMSGATLTGGVNSTQKRVDVTDGVGTNLLAIAKELRLHPQDKPDTDLSDDFVIPLAATAGALNFAYKLEDERIYNVEFNGYPDPTTRRLYFVGV
jgi:hypothetical protein